MTELDQTKVHGKGIDPSKVCKTITVFSQVYSIQVRSDDIQLSKSASNRNNDVTISDFISSNLLFGVARDELQSV